MKNIVLFASIILLLIITGCQGSLEEEAVQSRPNSENGVRVETEEPVYPTSVDEIKVNIINESDEEYSTGVHVFLEKKEQDTWYRVPMKADSFTEQAIGHSAHATSSLSLKISDLDYKLTPGEYRATIGGLGAPFKLE
ncbi:immunoglobulin-like domain-containing protein [Bacillus mesophilum]|uniref:Bacterial Ig-like domain-containing protein n=1 Tax=Bacillus mesophilum TaxID=1071718 RepID=A0A7V7UWI6_9BACI|nr:immunoglobulin-like domain-containing protein [Bacillus mesophilum]KAB2333954.1 hypothetical protein F7732_07675 [Bacillus mesophilum]